MATSGTVTEQAAVSLFAARRSVRSPQSSVLRFARRNPLGAVAAIVILTLVVSAVFAPLVAPYDPYFPDPINRLAAPSGQHLFGTDDIGRDVFSRVVYGGRISLQVGLLTVLLGTVVGATIGLVSAYWSGWADIVVQRLLDSLQSIPGLLLALVVASVIGAGTINTIFPIALILIPINARVVRSAVLSVREHQYIEAAHVLGCSHRRIMLRHILPNVVAPILILASIYIGNAIIVEASLSFLGLGTAPPTPSWGSMLSGQGRAYMEQAPWLAIFPGLAITVTVLSFNLLGDALRDTWDPRLRGR
jgi:peptide/nickel transport system permease protein